MGHTFYEDIVLANDRIKELEKLVTTLREGIKVSQSAAIELLMENQDLKTMRLQEYLDAKKSKKAKNAEDIKQHI